MKLKHLLLSLVCSCSFVNLKAIARYSACPLDYIPTLEAKENSFSFAYKTFNKNDCKKYLGRKIIIDRGYRPIQMVFYNNSNKDVTVNLSSFSHSCIPFDVVADAVAFDTSRRLLGWGLGGLILWPLLIPFTIEAICSPNANESLLRDFERKALPNHIIVKPHSTVNGLVFLRASELMQEFYFRAVDADGKTYNISLNCNNVIIA